MSTLGVTLGKPVAPSGALRRWLVPSVPELLFAAIALWLIGFTVTGDSTGLGLLRDSQTGYHIRVGRYILQHRQVPTTDFLSFTKSGEPFFAWEWLAAIGSALLYDDGGLRTIVVASSLVIALTVLLTLRHMAWRGANVIVAVFLIHMAIGASSIHYLARPHVFTLLFLAAALWILDRDRYSETRWIWALAPLTAIWANMHGGFFGLLVSLLILTCGSIAEAVLAGRPTRRVWRWGALTLACSAASLLNPYGWNEHLHLVRFMRQTWYLNLTEEYQRPNFLAAPGVYYGLLLAAGLFAAGHLLWKKEFASGLLIVAWAYASSRSVRHVPIFVIVALPWIAAAIAEAWDRWLSGASPKTLAGTLEKMAADYRESMNRTGFFAPALALLLLLAPLGISYPQDFPSAVYPAEMVNRHQAEIGQGRVFASDSWGHYLTYRFPPPFGVYIDGRTDFFGEQFSREYLRVMNGESGWDTPLKRERVNLVLVPPDLGLVGRLEENPQEWRLVDKTSEAVLYRAVR